MGRICAVLHHFLRDGLDHVLRAVVIAPSRIADLLDLLDLPHRGDLGIRVAPGKNKAVAHYNWIGTQSRLAIDLL